MTSVAIFFVLPVSVLRQTAQPCKASPPALAITAYARYGYTRFNLAHRRMQPLGIAKPLVALFGLLRKCMCGIGTGGGADLVSACDLLVSAADGKMQPAAVVQGSVLFRRCIARPEQSFSWRFCLDFHRSFSWCVWWGFVSVYSPTDALASLYPAVFALSTDWRLFFAAAAEDAAMKLMLLLTGFHDTFLFQSI
eukprot:IDg23783t1